MEYIVHLDYVINVNSVMNKNVVFLILGFSFFLINVKAQEFASSEAEYDSIYSKNITKSKLNGVYIPKDIADAHKRILKLTPAKDIKRFIAQPEEEVCRKLHLGIGRWMIVNWNFYDGSRLSHHLKELGLSDPDDMANFLLRTLHRHMNKVEPNHETLIEELVVARKKKVQNMINRN